MPTFDVDEMVKRIDAKIAELEAQEKEEKEKQTNSPSINDNKEILNPFAPKENISNPFEVKNEIPNPFEVKDNPVEKIDEIKIDEKEVKTPHPDNIKTFDELMGIGVNNNNLGGIVDPTKETKLDDYKKEEPSIKVDTSSKVMDNSNVSDDAFFDDFFEE